MTLKKTVIFVVLLVVALLVVLLGFSVYNSLDNSLGMKNLKQNSAAHQVDFLKDIKIKLPGEQPESYWELEVAKTENRGDRGRLSQVKGRYYVKGKLVYSLSGNRGEIFWQTRQLKINENVRLITNDGKRLQAEELVWNPKTQQITAVKQVVFTTDQVKVSTQKIIADLSIKKIVFSGPTKTIYDEVSKR